MAARLGPLALVLLALYCQTGWLAPSLRAQSLFAEADRARADEGSFLLAGVPGPSGNDLFSLVWAESSLHGGQAERPSELLFARSEQALPDEETRPERVPGEPAPSKEPRPDPGFQLPLAGPVFLFGQVNRDEVVPSPASTLAGQTGVAWKLPLAGAAEVLFCCGPELASAELAGAGRSQDRAPFLIQPHWLRLDIHCRWFLAKEVGLEYQGTACPAFNPWERDRISQDLRVVLPVGSSGQLRFGARYCWENSDDPKLGTEGSQLYGGLRLRW